MTRITHIALDDANMPPPTPEIDQERKVAMFDLLEENSFVLPARDKGPAPEGPYHLSLSIRDKRLVFDVQTEGAEKAAELHLSLGPFRQVSKTTSKSAKAISRRSRNSRPARLRPSTWPAAAFTTKAPACCKSASRAKPRSTPTPRGVFSP